MKGHLFKDLCTSEQSINDISPWDRLAGSVLMYHHICAALKPYIHKKRKSPA
jgi:hypothetical protein